MGGTIDPGPGGTRGEGNRWSQDFRLGRGFDCQMFCSFKIGLK